MRRMAAHATFAKRLMLKHERPPLRRVTLEAGFVLAQQGHSPALARLGHACSASFDRISFVRIMTIGATDLVLEDRMMVRHVEFRPDLQVALEARLRRPARIDDGAGRAAALNMKAARPMAGFAANILRSVPDCLETRVGGRVKIARNDFVTGLAVLRTDKLGTRNTGRGNDCVIAFEATARKKDDSKCSSDADHPPEPFISVVNPSSQSRVRHAP